MKIPYLSVSLMMSALWLVPLSLRAGAEAEGGTPAIPPGEAPAAVTAEMEAMARWQIFLDRAGFGPGRIDGKDGTFTKLAKEYFEKSAKGAAVEGDDPSTSVDPVFVMYKVTAEDVKAVGKIPEKPEDQAKLETLPYETVAEGVAEKFHCDVDFFHALNPRMGAALKEGDAVKVPNIEPFEPEAVKTVEIGAAYADAEKPPVIRIVRSTAMLEVIHEGKVQAAFPVSIGSEKTETVAGKWKLVGMERMPKFRRDKQMLEEGTRSDDFVMLPPGPNNPVGILWMEVNKEGIGIHGTAEPDTIGRASSHGCIRLANWDILRLAGMVKGGVEVEIE